MKKKITIHWFRQDLRLEDNPALCAAAEHDSVLPIYIDDNVNPGEYTPGSSSQWWLHHSLGALKESLNGNLSIYQANPIDIFKILADKYVIEAVYWNRCYEPWHIDRDGYLKDYLKSQSITVETFNGSLLWEPWTIAKKDGTPYKVFTPFYRKGCLQAAPPRQPLKRPGLQGLLFDSDQSLDITQLNLLPGIKWYTYIEKKWYPGEKGAKKKLQKFLKEGINDYKIGRDFPAKKSVSELSAHLHFGEVSPNELWYRSQYLGDNENIAHFCRELGWREFSYSQLYFNPGLPNKNLQSKFDRFPWRDSQVDLEAWQQGRTGIPMVDAGMRELWQTGYMHNRVRMIVGSFLVKNLLLDWRHGERWFWDTLIDADLANNSAGWQWVAGCGADAAPYFRIFNPVTQGQRFDPEGIYTRSFIPELSQLPNKYLFNPWEAPAEILEEADVRLGDNYPYPIVDLKNSRQSALAAFQSLKKEQ